jgi:hypothetical protein
LYGGAWPFDSDFGFYTDNHASITRIFREEAFGGRGEILLQGVFVNKYASENFQKHYLAMSYNGKKDVYVLDYVPFENFSIELSVINIIGNKISVIGYYGGRCVLIDVDTEKKTTTLNVDLRGRKYIKMRIWILATKNVGQNLI